MKKLTNLHQIDFYEKISVIDPLWDRPIEDLFPISFDKYCKIFHQFRLSSDFKSMTEETWNHNSDWVIRFFDGEEDYEHNHALETYELKPVQLLAKLYNETFDKFFNTDKVSRHWKKNQPKWFLCPDSGTLDEKSCARLINVLMPFTKESFCYFHYVPYAIDTYEETIFEGKLTELKDTLLLGLSGTPSNIWSEKKNWFISTPYDTDFSIVAGAEEIINSILADKEIDAYEFARDEILIQVK